MWVHWASFWAELVSKSRTVGSCDMAAEGYRRWMEGKLDGCKWALGLNGTVFLFMKDWSSRGAREMNEICMERPYCTRPPDPWLISAQFCVGSTRCSRSAGRLATQRNGSDAVWPHGVKPQTDTDWLLSDMEQKVFNLFNTNFTLKLTLKERVSQFFIM